MSNEKKISTIHKHILNLSYDTTTLSQYEDYRIYRNAVILAPGEWTDSITHNPVVYSEVELTRGATNWKENYLNIDHSFSVNDRIGYVMNQHADKGKVLGDLYINKNVQTGKDTIERIDCNLINGVSAELTTNDIYDYKTNKYLASDLTFLGCAIVTYPAAIGSRVR
jgi:hypothetical protein